jgi:GrpB-like predicted nucleotidyltransferase (UPF0157 family)
MSEPIRLVAYDARWPALFVEQARGIRAALGQTALRIDHIGSTAVPGLAAKPIVDIQISVASFEPLDAFRVPLEGLGYVFRADNRELTKRYFREPPGTRRTHIQCLRARRARDDVSVSRRWWSSWCRLLLRTSRMGDVQPGRRCRRCGCLLPRWVVRRARCRVPMASFVARV